MPGGRIVFFLCSNLPFVGVRAAAKIGAFESGRESSSHLTLSKHLRKILAPAVGAVLRWRSVNRAKKQEHNTALAAPHFFFSRAALFRGLVQAAP